jgi:hypothetical protein
MDSQKTKKKALEFIKSTKNILNKIFIITEYHNTQSFYIYNGMMLTKEIENIQYSIIHNRVSINKLKNDDIYIINELENKHNTFNLIK